MPLPAFRHVDVGPVEHEGQTMICLQDPEGYVDAPVLLSPAAFLIATLLDGTNDILDIQYHFVNHTGRIIPAEDIHRIVAYLDEHGFLLTPRFDELSERIRKEFQEAATRPARLAGKSYPAESKELKSYLDACFTREGGPGVLPVTVSGGDGPLKALIAPHIDFDRGGHSYAHAYLQLAKSSTPKTAFVFGVAHGPTQTPFTLTRKHFETPFGAVPTDTGAVEALAGACAWDPFVDEMVHRTEHSIEFQVVMLRHIFGPEIAIVPILCGAFPEGPLLNNTAGGEGVQGFLRVCGEMVRERNGQACVIAGADLAHVGKRFGDPFDIDDAITAQVEARDREDLAFVAALDADGWFRSVMKDGNRRRVCGVNCIYAALKTVEGYATHAEVLHYGHAPDPAGGIVSFAGIAVS
mgnify:CR=1 FL=1